MPVSTLIVRVDALRSVAFGSITGSYTALGTALQHNFRIIKLVNATNTAMFFSFNGTTDNDYLPANSFSLYDLTTNGVDVEFVFQKQTQVYVKYASAPASGAVYVMGIYGQGE